MERIYRKDVEAQMRAKAEKKMVSTPLKRENPDGSFWSSFEDGVRPLGKASLDSLFRNCTYEECKQLLKEAFNDAAEKYDLPIEVLKFVKGWRAGSQIQGFRIESDEEFEARIQRDTDSKVNQLRQYKKNVANDRANKKKQIKKLEAELEKLKK